MLPLLMSEWRNHALLRLQVRNRTAENLGLPFKEGIGCLAPDFNSWCPTVHKKAAEFHKLRSFACVYRKWRAVLCFDLTCISFLNSTKPVKPALIALSSSLVLPSDWHGFFLWYFQFGMWQTVNKEHDPFGALPLHLRSLFRKTN